LEHTLRPSVPSVTAIGIRPGSSNDHMPLFVPSSPPQQPALITNTDLPGNNVRPTEPHGHISNLNVPSTSTANSPGASGQTSSARISLRNPTGVATTTSGTPLNTDDSRATQQRSIHHFFQTKVASGVAFIAMVTQGLLAPAPVQAVVTTPFSTETHLSPPSLTMITPQTHPADIGDLASPQISPYSLGVLEKLRSLPTYDALTTLTYCPKGSARRFGILYASAFWYQNVAMDCSELHQEFYALLAFHLPMLILHDCRPLSPMPIGAGGPRPPDAAGSSEQVSTRTKVKDRLALAE
jgi:hypothetical protein